MHQASYQIFGRDILGLENPMAAVLGKVRPLNLPDIRLCMKMIFISDRLPDIRPCIRLITKYLAGDILGLEKPIAEVLEKVSPRNWPYIRPGLKLSSLSDRLPNIRPCIRLITQYLTEDILVVEKPIAAVLEKVRPRNCPDIRPDLKLSSYRIDYRISGRASG